MGHTQWMPEVWLNVGMDYDRDGRVSPFGKPDDALGSSARFLVNRGNITGANIGAMRCARRAEPSSGSRTYAVRRAPAFRAPTGQPFPQSQASAQMWVPVAGGPAFRWVRIFTRKVQ